MGQMLSTYNCWLASLDSLCFHDLEELEFVKDTCRETDHTVWQCAKVPRPSLAADLKEQLALFEVIGEIMPDELFMGTQNAAGVAVVTTLECWLRPRENDISRHSWKRIDDNLETILAKIADNGNPVITSDLYADLDESSIRLKLYATEWHAPEEVSTISVRSGAINPDHARRPSSAKATRWWLPYLQRSRCSRAAQDEGSNPNEGPRQGDLRSRVQARSLSWTRWDQGSRRADGAEVPCVGLRLVEL